jgi:TfoX/Sxy family transcriptional regulator of competence genes
VEGKMEWRKAPVELKVFLDSAVVGVKCEKRIMFGCPAYFVKKNMFIGIFQESVFVRLSPEQMNELSLLDKSMKPFEPMPGRKMKEYFVVPKNILVDKKVFKGIIEKAAEYTGKLRRKEKRKSKKG